MYIVSLLLGHGFGISQLQSPLSQNLKGNGIITQAVYAIHIVIQGGLKSARLLGSRLLGLCHQALPGESLNQALRREFLNGDP